MATKATAPPTANAKAIAQISQIKLKTLEQQFQSFERELTEFEKAYQSANSGIDRLHLINDLFGSNWDDIDDERDKVDDLLVCIDSEFQDKYERVAQTWADNVYEKVKLIKTKHHFAQAFSAIILERIQNSSSDVSVPEPDVQGDTWPDTASEWSVLSESNSSMNADLPEPSLMKKQAIQMFERTCFGRDTVDGDKLTQFIQEKLLVPHKNFDGPWGILTEAIQNFSYRALNDKIDKDGLKELLGSMSKSKYFAYCSEEIQSILGDETTLAEMIEVLHLMLDDVQAGRWIWRNGGNSVAFNRMSLKDKYRPQISMDTISQVFVEYVGIIWSECFAEKLLQFTASSAWKWGGDSASKSITSVRSTLHRSTFCNANLKPFLGNTASSGRGRGRAGRFKRSHNSYDRHDEDNSEEPPIDRYFRVLTADCRLYQAIQPTEAFTAIQTDILNFGPTVSHRVILELLKALKVSDRWIQFFMAFLEMPILWGPSQTPRQRTRGINANCTLSKLFGELILFFMDFYINRTTDGVTPARFYDDIWICTPSASAATTAWKSMNEYLGVVGLSLNLKKTGSVSVFSPAHLSDVQKTDVYLYGPSPLPRSPIVWEFLILKSDGQFYVDLEAIKPYIADLQGRLARANSVIEWITTYNRFMKFFLRGFGKVSRASGEHHCREIVKALDFIHAQLFPEHHGNAADTVKDLIYKRIAACATMEIPDWWLYWPSSSGGLELFDPYIDVLAMLRQLHRQEGFVELLEGDENLYTVLEKLYARKKLIVDKVLGAAAENKELEEYLLDKWKTSFGTFFKSKHNADRRDVELASLIKLDATRVWNLALGARETVEQFQLYGAIGDYKGQAASPSVPASADSTVLSDAQFRESIEKEFPALKLESGDKVIYKSHRFTIDDYLRPAGDAQRENSTEIVRLISREEFKGLRMSHLPHWNSVFTKLINSAPEVEVSVDFNDDDDYDAGHNSPYWKNIFGQFHYQFRRSVGNSVRFISPTQIPNRLISLWNREAATSNS